MCRFLRNAISSDIPNTCDSLHDGAAEGSVPLVKLLGLGFGHDSATEGSVPLVKLVGLGFGHDGAAKCGGGLVGLGVLDLGHFDGGSCVKGVKLVKRGLRFEVVIVVGDGRILVSRWRKSCPSLYHATDVKMACAIRSWFQELFLLLFPGIVPRLLSSEEHCKATPRRQCDASPAADQSPGCFISHRCIDLSFTSNPIVLECGAESPMQSFLRIITFILFLVPLQLEATPPADQHHFSRSP